MSALPKKLIVTPEGECKPGLAVLLRFKMVRKNDYSFILFLSGRKELSQNELLKEFDQTVTFFPMDYVKASTGFTGEIQAKILNRLEIQAAILAYEKFKKHWDYPADYLTSLRMALISNQESNCIISLEQIH